MKILTIVPRARAAGGSSATSAGASAAEAADAGILAEDLAALGEVTTLALDPAAAELDPAPFADGAFDLTLFWRTETLAERVVPFGLRRAVIVPSATPRPGPYWQQFTGAAWFLCFSRRLHEHLEAHACRSAVFDYWPAPAATPVPPLEDGASPTAVFVDTGGEGLPTAGSVAQQCRRLGIDDLTVIGPDAAAAPDGPLARTAAPDGALTRAAVVFASPAAGLDLQVREAMGRGQVVIAPDLAPTNETVGHLSSGLLVDPKHPTELPPLGRETLARLAHGARHKALAGRRTWEADRPRLASLLTGDGRRWATTDPAAHLGNAVQKALHRRRIHG